MLDDIVLEPLSIPFKHDFSHHQKTHHQTDSVIVKAVAKNHMGVGEACPRDYVTDESFDSIAAFFERFKHEFLGIDNLTLLKIWACERQHIIDENQAGWCAIEIALLDFLAKKRKRTLEHLLSLPELGDGFKYSAVLGINDIDGFSSQLTHYLQFGFTDFKLKISGNLNADKEKIALLKATKGVHRLRLDANNLWQEVDEAIQYIKALDYPFFAIEEPLAVNDYDGMLAVSKTLSLPIILDESFLRLCQFKHIALSPANWIINVRVSKMGGLLRALAISQEAKELGVPIIVGSQVGETSILTRAALAVANTYKDILVAQEGAFGLHLLSQDVCQPSLMFGEMGILHLHASEEPYGLGLVYQYESE